MLTSADIRGSTPAAAPVFLILVILVSIVLYAVLPWSGTMLRVLYKLAMLPLLVGICYEIFEVGRAFQLAAGTGCFGAGALAAAPDDL